VHISSIWLFTYILCNILYNKKENVGQVFPCPSMLIEPKEEVMGTMTASLSEV
jgi:hypothetical protein